MRFIKKNENNNLRCSGLLPQSITNLIDSKISSTAITFLLTQKKCKCSGECQSCAILVFCNSILCSRRNKFINIDKANTLHYRASVRRSGDRTRTGGASFANSVVFPGGVNEPADGDERWLHLLGSYGYNKQDFATLHHSSGVLSPIFKNNPIQRHIELRITAIRETFEELGLLICSKNLKQNKKGIWGDFVTDIDVKYWQKRVSTNPGDLFKLCEEHSCYPDIWSLHYWSNWLTPHFLPKRFDTAFFVTALQEKPDLKSSSEVVSVEWSNPQDILKSSNKLLFPPQTYELHRLSELKEVEELIKFASERSQYGAELIYPHVLKLKNGLVQILPGDDLYPTSIDYSDNTIKYIDKTILELREDCNTLHRLESEKGAERTFVFKNYKPQHHVVMGDRTISFMDTL